MEWTEIGEIELTPQGDLLRLTIAEWHNTTTLSLRGVRAVLDYLHAWVAEQESVRHEEALRIDRMARAGTERAEHYY